MGQERIQGRLGKRQGGEVNCAEDEIIGEKMERREAGVPGQRGGSDGEVNFIG
jgi:hypothetical protein